MPDSSGNRFMPGRTAMLTRVMYEELKKDPHRWQALSEYLDLDLSRAAEAKEINSTARSAGPIPSVELRLLEREVAEVATGLGYRPER